MNRFLTLALLLSLTYATDVTIKTDGTGADANGVSIQNSSSAELMVIEGNGDASIGDTTFHVDATNNKVGLGTTSPTTQLHVTGTEGLLIQGTYTSGTALTLGAETRMHFYPKKAAFRAGYVDGTQWDDANVGGYSTALGGHVTASGYASTATGWVSTTASGDYSTAMGFYTTAESGFETVIGRYNTDYTPTSTMGYSMTDRIFVVGNGANSGSKSDAFLILKNGNTTMAGTLYESSDFRLKKRIRPIESSLDKVLKLDGKYFYWNDVKPHDMENEQIGLIAQEVQEVIPQLVTTDQTEDAYLSVNYQGFVPVLINAIKEQQEMIESQQAQIDQLMQALAFAPEKKKESFWSRLVSVFKPKSKTEFGSKETNNENS